MDGENPPVQPVPLRDPTNDRCPDYGSADYDMVRTAMTANGAMTEEQASAALRAGWQAGHDREVAAWRARLEEAQLNEAEDERRRRDEEEAANEEERRKREEEQKALDKKKLKLAKVTVGTPPTDNMRQRVSDFAREKLAKYAYIELDYFSAKARESAEAQARASSSDLMILTQSEAGYSITQGSAQRPLKGIRRDADLPFADMLVAWPVFLKEIDKTRTWEKAHVVQYYNLFTALSGHEDAQDPLGQRALMLYLDEIRNDWHDSIIAKSVDDTVFDISAWSDRRYDACKQRIKDRTTSSLLNEARTLLPPERDRTLTK